MAEIFPALLGVLGTAFIGVLLIYIVFMFIINGSSNGVKKTSSTKPPSGRKKN